MENIFTKYGDIENSYRDAFIDKIIFSGFSKEQYHVEEKIHGANFQFNMTGDVLVAGKRTGFVREGEDFFSWKLVFEKYKDAVIEFKKQFCEPNWDIILYGELYGGTYPHPDVKQDSKFARVQKEIFYRPDEDFICFDIFISIPSEDRSYFLSKTTRDIVCDKFGIPYAKSLFKGTFEECLKYHNEFLTTIPKELGLPDIEDNTCEGVVIRPEDDLRLKTGERAIVKNKNSKFSEKKSKPKIARIPEAIPEHIQAMLDKIDDYINENRINNMLSKVGTPNPKDFGLYIQTFSKDVYQDFFKDNSEEFKAWTKGDQKNFQKHVNFMIVGFLKENLLTKI